MTNYSNSNQKFSRRRNVTTDIHLGNNMFKFKLSKIRKSTNWLGYFVVYKRLIITINCPLV